MVVLLVLRVLSVCLVGVVVDGFVVVLVVVAAVAAVDDVVALVVDAFGC